MDDIDEMLWDNDMMLEGNHQEQEVGKMRLLLTGILALAVIGLCRAVVWFHENLCDHKSVEPKKEKQKGFTLIELLILVAIIGILAAIAIPKFARLMYGAPYRLEDGKVVVCKIVKNTSCGYELAACKDGMRYLCQPKAEQVFDYYEDARKDSRPRAVPDRENSQIVRE